MREQDRWIIGVRDNGIGFEPQYAKQIFGLFKRLHRIEYPGTGLGLVSASELWSAPAGKFGRREQAGASYRPHVDRRTYGALRVSVKANMPSPVYRVEKGNKVVMSFAARLGYIVGTIMLGAVVGRLLAGWKNQNGSGTQEAPVAKLAEELGKAWAPYHNR